MDLSLFLAKLLGLFFVLLGLAVLFNRRAYQEADMQILKKHQPLALIFGMVLLLGGLAVVLSHNIWEVSWVGLITLIGWLALIKACLILMLPDVLDVLKKKTFGDAWYVVGGILWVGIGAYLTYMGFFV